MSAADAEDDFPNDASLYDIKERTKIVPKDEHFPCCLVWCPLPIISVFLPIVGHAGIVASDGTIYDYAADYVVETNPHKTIFGPVAKYWPASLVQTSSGALSAWDEAIRDARDEFVTRRYNLFTNNCHDYVNQALNQLNFMNSKWNDVNLALGFMLHGKYVDNKAIIRTWAPFCVVVLILFILILICCFICLNFLHNIIFYKDFLLTL